MAKLKLHTDSYTDPSVKVVRHTARHRVAILKDGQVPRSFAVTIFPLQPNHALNEVNEAVRSSGLMGMTFRKYGFIIAQNRLLLTHFWVPECITRQLNVEKGTKLCIEVYEFYGGNHLYGTVIEFTPLSTHMPDRPAHGARLLWRILGRSDEFHTFLHGSGAETGSLVRAFARAFTPIVAFLAVVRSMCQASRTQ